MDKVLKAIRERGPITIQSLSTITFHSERSVTLWVRQLIAQGHVEQINTMLPTYKARTPCAIP